MALLSAPLCSAPGGEPPLALELRHGVTSEALTCEMFMVYWGSAGAARGLTQRDSHSLLDLALIAASEGGGVMLRGA